LSRASPAPPVRAEPTRLSLQPKRTPCLPPSSTSTKYAITGGAMAPALLPGSGEATGGGGLPASPGAFPDSTPGAAPPVAAGRRASGAALDRAVPVTGGEVPSGWEAVTLQPASSSARQPPAARVQRPRPSQLHLFAMMYRHPIREVQWINATAALAGADVREVPVGTRVGHGCCEVPKPKRRSARHADCVPGAGYCRGS